MDLDLTRPLIKITLVPDRIQRSVGRVFFFVPYRVKVYICARIFDVECYASELLIFIPYTAILVLAIPFSLAGATDKTVGMIFRRAFVEDESLQRCAPRLMKWGKVVAGLLVSLKERLEVARGTCVSESVKPLFTPTPDEAVAIQQSYRRLRRQTPSPTLTPGAVRVYYFRSLDKGRYRSGSGHQLQPDAWMDLYVDSQSGVDLGIARRTWGLESLAIITDKDPHRSVFHPADQDRLSPLAAYDLSNQWTQPIRVFEPRTSSITPTARQIRGAVYPTLFFIWTFSKLLVGFPENNTKYLGLLYGQSYASMYDSIGNLTRDIRQSASEALQFLVLLPIVLIYKLLLGIKAAALWSFKAVVRSVPAAIEVVGSGVGVAVNLEWKAWLIILGVFWYAFAEYLGSKA